MAINPRGIAIGAGAAFGGYTSNIEDNPLTGILSTGIGATVGGFMQLPTADLKKMSKVIKAPVLDLDYIKTRTISEMDEKAIDAFQNKLLSFRKSKEITKSFEERAKSVNFKFSSEIDRVNSKYNGMLYKYAEKRRK